MSSSNPILQNQYHSSFMDDGNDDHYSNSAITPLRPDAFEKTDAEKMTLIAYHFKEIMLTMGLDLTDDSLKETPFRVAKMFIKEIFSGLNPLNMPGLQLFDNKYKYHEMLIEKNITLYSYCEHHFVPIIGKVHVAYIADNKVIGLSKINRLVQHFAKRPQVQERLTNQIADALKSALQTENVAVIVDAFHLCVSSRGIKDTNASTQTFSYSGKFKDDNTKLEFLTSIGVLK